MSTKITAIIGVALALGLTLASGAVQRKMNGEWSSANAMVELADRLNSLPESFGPWELTDKKELGDYAEQTLKCEGYINHTYVHRDTRQLVNVAVILGPPGPVSVHIPEICYSSRDFTQIEDRTAIDVEDSNDSASRLWSLKFQANDVDARQLNVYYGWTTDGRWQAAANPRFEFAGQPYLLKLQMAAELTGEEASGDICQAFLSEFLPVLRQTVFGEQTL